MEIKNTNYLYNYGIAPTNNSQSSVSFKGRQDSYTHLKDSDSVKTAFDTTKKLLTLPAEDLTLEKLQQFVNIPVKPMSEYKNRNNYSSPRAVLSYTTNREGKCSNFTMYIPSNIAQDKQGKSSFLATLTHEYTHYLQFQQKDFPQKQFFDELKMAGLNVPEIMGDILKGADEAFRSSLTLMYQGVSTDLVWQKYYKAGDSNDILLGDIEINDNKMAKSVGYDDAEEFIKYFKHDFPEFKEIAQKTINSNPYLKQMYNMYPQIMQDAIKNLIITYCRDHAKQEAEAYFAENKVLHTQGFDERGSEIGYKYFDLIARALA